MEIVISVTIIALILSTLGMSFIATQKLRLNNEINAKLHKCGETIIGYLFTLPPTDGYIYSVDQTNRSNDSVLSLADLVNQNANGRLIISTLNDILMNQARSQGFQVLNNSNSGNPAGIGAVVRFDPANPRSNNNSRIIINTQGNINTITVELYHVWIGARGIRRGRIIRVNRLLIQW